MTHDARRCRLRRCLQHLAGNKGPGPDEREQLALSLSNALPAEVVAKLGAGAATDIEQRVSLFRRAVALSPACTATVAGREEEARLSMVELWRFYLPLCSLFCSMAGRSEGARVLVGIAGPPASGKSIFASLLRRILNEAVAHDAPPVAEVCALDGFHYPNDYLDTHFTAGESGRASLRSVKGGPATFDVAAFVDTLRALRARPSMRLPAYDRTTHDPVPNAIHIQAHHRIVLVEGNYLLLDHGRWAEVAPLLDATCFLILPLEEAKKAAIARHIRGGRQPQDAERHFRAVDLENRRICMDTADRADLIIERSNEQRIVAIRANP